MGGKNQGGGKHKHRKKNPRTRTSALNDVLPDDINSFIGKIIKKFGDGRMLFRNTSGDEHMGRKKKTLRGRLDIGDYVLYEVCNDMGGSNTHAIYKYSDKDVSELKMDGYIQETEKTDEDI